MSRGVLLIRAEQTQDPLELLVRDRGFEVFTHSMVDIRPCVIAESQSRPWFESKWDGIVVVSPNAVRFFEQLRKNNSWPKPRLGYFTVGPGTASPLREHSQGPVTWPMQAHQSEALLALPELQQVAGQNWLIITGENGRSLIQSTLTERGASVSLAEVYRRIPTGESLSEQLSLWRERVSRIVVTSKEQAELFCQQLRSESMPSEAIAWAQACHWCVPSKRIANVLFELNIPTTQIHYAHSAVHNDLLKALTKINVEKPMSDSSSNTENTSPPRESRFWTRLLIALLVLSVMTLAAGGWYLWQQNQQFQTSTEQEFDALRTRLSQAQMRDSEFEEQLAARMKSELETGLSQESERQQRTMSTLAEQQAQQQERFRERMSQYERDIARLSQRVSQVESRHSQSWVLQEAYDRVNVAIQRLSVDGNTRVALLLLKAAKEILHEDGGYRGIEDQLARDIDMINEYPTVDYSGVAMLLQELQRSVSQLPLLKASIDAEQRQAEQHDTASSADWRANLANAWQAFSNDMIRIQRNTELPLQLNLEQRLAMNSRLELQLQLAQQSLMQRQQELFNSTLVEIHRLVSTYFNKEANETAQFLASIEALGELDISPDFPTTLLSRAMLRERLRDLENTPRAPEESRP